MTDRVDVVVIGGGIAGVSAACELALAGRAVVLVEQETQLAQHTTGRSAAVFLESYGPPAVRALSKASRPLFEAAEARLGAPDVLTPRQSLWLAPADQVAELDRMLRDLPGLHRLSEREVLDVCPFVRLDTVAAAALEPDAAAMDVLGLHQGYVRTGVGAGMRVVAGWPVRSIVRQSTGFLVESVTGERWSCEQIVVAAGAWSDQVGALAGARPIGLQPMRRTIAICRTTAELGPGGPLVGDTHTYYWRPEGPNVLCSPADETPSEPCDARPEELDVALAIERVNQTTTLQLRSVVTTWAGLRTFTTDRVPVCGPDPDVEGMFWLAGQGGYGIQTAPAMAQTLRNQMLGEPLPPGFAAAGITLEALSAGRFRA